MTLPTTGALTAAAINTEIGVAATSLRDLNDASTRSLAVTGTVFPPGMGVLTANTPIEFRNFYGASTSITVSYLIVGGGGGGGVGGGGGGGDVISGSTTLTGTSYAVTVGLGGTRCFTNGVVSTNDASGGDSSFDGVTAEGGGGGAGSRGRTTTDNLNTYLGDDGPTGGGSGGNLAGYGVVVAGGTGTAGRNGGSCSGNNGSPSGGGGGAGGAGGNASAGSPGAGGVGVSSPITGTPVFYGGGGGGGSHSAGAAAGGAGGGGAGSQGSTNAGNGTNGLGGGGGGNSNNGSSGNGGSGVVIVSYDSATQRFIGGAVTSYAGGTSGTMWVHTFTASGTLTRI